MGNILEVIGLTKLYKRFSLSNVSFALPEGCIAGFIGINGAGKTTTIRSVLGLVQKDAGTVNIFGKNSEHNERELKNRIGVVLDEGCFYENLSMAEMKSIIAPAYSRWDNSTFNKYMINFSLNPRQKISDLSKGMRMKFSLALALSHNAELLIMDEPTSGLDPLIRGQLLDIISDFMKQGGKGVFYSTHITSDLEKSADMLILINNGKILFEQEKDSLLDCHRLVKGDVKALNDGNKGLFLSIKVSDYGFSGITDRISDVRKSIPDVFVEKPTVEDIMLCYVERGNCL